MGLKEGDLFVLMTTFPSKARDFLFVKPVEDGAYEAVHPLDLLSLDRAARHIQRLRRKDEPLALVLALCRLLVPALRYRGSGRHLVVEPWSLTDLQGGSIPGDVGTLLARDLSVEQANDFRAVTIGETPPEGSLPELFWSAFTDLPVLPAVFDDPELGQLAKALYFHLVEEGEGMAEVDSATVTAKVAACRKEHFAPLKLEISPRKLQPLFRKLLGVTVRYSSQLTGAVVEEMINLGLRRGRRRRLTAVEREMLHFRYGAVKALNDINVGFLFGCGPLLADLVNDYFLTLTGIRPEGDRKQAEETLKAFVYLLCGFQRRRKYARAHERREDRQSHADRMPHGPRHQAEFQPDTSVAAPETIAAGREELALLRQLLPQLKERDAERLQALIDCDGDRKAAAAKLGVEPKAFSRQLRQTVVPAVRALARKTGFNPLSEEGET